MSGLQLSEDEKMILGMYINQYTHINSQINNLIQMSNDVRSDIQRLLHGTIGRNRIDSQSRPRYQTRRNNVPQNETETTTPLFQNLFSEILPLSERRTTNPLQYRDVVFEYTFTPLGSNTNSRTDFNQLLSDFLNSSVPITPTDEELSNATTEVRYGDIDNPLSETCPISLERFSENQMVRQIRQCGHIFCQEPFEEWFRTNVRCPVCRYDIRTYNSNNNNNSSNSISTDTSVNYYRTNTNTSNAERLLQSLFNSPNIRGAFQRNSRNNNS